MKKNEHLSMEFLATDKEDGNIEVKQSLLVHVVHIDS
jgi:hypothetical protein